jgi:hypothetical protein
LSSTARQVALNFDMAISCIHSICTMVNNHGLEFGHLSALVAQVS